MTTTRVTLPGNIRVRAGGELDQAGSDRPDWGVYADGCWLGWPGVVLDWPDFGVPANTETTVVEILRAFAHCRVGRDVLVGCRGGTGRTGTLLAALAVAAGVPARLAVGWVRTHYRPNAVEAREQEEWLVSHFAADHRVKKESTKSRDRVIRSETSRLKSAMRGALQLPERSPVLEWAVPEVLAVTQRPLRAHPVFGGSGREYPAEARAAIEQWIARLLVQGIRSIVALTSFRELAHYRAPTAAEGGLLALYRLRGLEVAHFAADDPAHDATARAAFNAAVDEIADRVADALRHLPTPAAVHCSAAIDRSPPVAARVAFLWEVGGVH